MRAAADCTNATLPDAGLGLYEYMMLAEALNAEPVWVINAGISHQQDTPTSQIAPWIEVNAAEALPGLQTHCGLRMTTLADSGLLVHRQEELPSRVQSSQAVLRSASERRMPWTRSNSSADQPTRNGDHSGQPWAEQNPGT